MDHYIVKIMENKLLVITNLFKKLLVKFRYRNKRDPFKEFQKIMTNKFDKEINKGTILIAPYRVSPISNLFEGLIAYYFRLKGYNVKAIMCNQAVNICENLSKNKKRNCIDCSLCLAEQNRFCKVFNVEKISLNDFITKKEREIVTKLVNSRSFNVENDFLYNDLNFKEEIESAVKRYTLSSNINDKKNIIREFSKTAFLTSIALEKIQAEEKAIQLILSHGIYSTWGSLLKTANKVNLKSTVWGRGYVGQGNLVFGKNKSYLEEVLNDDNWKEISITEEEEVVIKEYYVDKFKGDKFKRDYINYYNELQYEDFNKKSFFNEIDKYKYKFGMYTNIPWDGEVFNKSKGFPNNVTYITSVINWFINNPDNCLVIRPHPAEKSGNEALFSEKFEDILYDLYPILPDNVKLLSPENPITSYELVNKVDANIIYGSSLSLEFAVMGFLVIQTGNFNVNNKGIVYEANTIEELYEFMRSASLNKLIVTDEMKRNALNYANYWINYKHLNDETMNLEKLKFKNFKFKNLIEFENNRTLGIVFDSITKDEIIIDKND